MSFPYDPSQGQPAQFGADGNTNAGAQQPGPQQSAGMQQQQQQQQPQMGQESGSPGPFQQQGGVSTGSVGGGDGGDAKTTLW